MSEFDLKAHIIGAMRFERDMEIHVIGGEAIDVKRQIIIATFYELCDEDIEDQVATMANNYKMAYAKGFDIDKWIDNVRMDYGEDLTKLPWRIVVGTYRRIVDLKL